MIKIVMFFCFAVVAMPANAGNLSQMYLDKGVWVNFDWKNADKTLLWTDDGFQPYLSKVTDDGQKFHHNQTIDIKGRGYNVSLVSNTNRLEYSDYTTLSLKEVKAGDCESLEREWTQVFGNHFGLVNSSYYLMTKSYGLLEKAYQWDVGKTRITLECGSVGSEGGLEYISFKYESANLDSKMEKPFHLSCSRKYLILGSKDGEWSNAQPLVITVIPAKKAITDPELVFLGELKVISDSYIEFSIDANNLSLSFQISRIDGTLTGSALDKKTGLRQAKVEGTCEARVPSTRKF